MDKPHLNVPALVALVDRDERGRTVIARDAQVLPSVFSDYLAGRSLALRDFSPVERIAAALEVETGAITCWCDRPEGRCRNLGGGR